MTVCTQRVTLCVQRGRLRKALSTPYTNDCTRASRKVYCTIGCTRSLIERTTILRDICVRASVRGRRTNCCDFRSMKHRAWIFWLRSFSEARSFSKNYHGRTHGNFFEKREKTCREVALPCLSFFFPSRRVFGYYLFDTVKRFRFYIPPPCGYVIALRALWPCLFSKSSLPPRIFASFPYRYAKRAKSQARKRKKLRKLLQIFGRSDIIEGKSLPFSKK